MDAQAPNRMILPLKLPAVDEGGSPSEWGGEHVRVPAVFNLEKV